LNEQGYNSDLILLVILLFKKLFLPGLRLYV
jgi:hypothetical protein